MTLIWLCIRRGTGEHSTHATFGFNLPAARARWTSVPPLLIPACLVHSTILNYSDCHKLYVFIQFSIKEVDFHFLCFLLARRCTILQQGGASVFWVVKL